MAVHLSKTEGDYLESKIKKDLASKPTPIECLEHSYPMTDARLMEPEDLTREDCVKLLEGGFEQYVIRMRYGFTAEAWLARMKEWGLNKPARDWDFRSERGKQAKQDPTRDETVGVDPNKAEVARTAAMLAQEPVQEETLVVSEPPAEEQKPTAIEWLRKHKYLPSMEQIRILTLADLTRADAEALLAAGVSKYKLLRMYGIKQPAKYYYDKVDAVLQKEPDKSAEIGADRVKTVLTEAEKQDLFADPEPLISAVVAQAVEAGQLKIETATRPTPPPTFDLTAWELVTGECPRQGHPVLHIGARGDSAIVFTDLQVGDKIAFRINPAAAGRMLAVVKADNGKPLMAEKGTKRRLRFSSKALVLRLAAYGVRFPANYTLTWNEDVGAWIGELAEKRSESEAM